MPFSDPAAERAVLAGICAYGRDVYVETSEILTSQCFTIDLNRAMYTCLSHIFERNLEAKLDLHLVLSAAHDLGLTTTFDNDHLYIGRVMSFPVELSNVRPFAQKIRKLLLAKEYDDKLELSQVNLRGVTGNETVDEIRAVVEGDILNFSHSLTQNTSDIIHIADGLDQYLADIEKDPGKPVGVSTGFPIYDASIGGGMRRQSVNVIVARPGIGKTLLADSVSLHAAGRLKIPVLEIDSELTEKGHWPRILAKLARVSIGDIESGRYLADPLARKRVRAASEALKEIPFSYVNVSGKSFDEILSFMRRWILQTVGYTKGRTNDCLIVFDYLKLTNPDELKTGYVNESQLIGFYMTALHDFTVQYDVPCLTFVQANRSGIKSEESDIIADSDRVLRLASSVYLYKEKIPAEIINDGKEYGNRKMVKIKTRYGEGLADGDYLHFAHTKQFALIEELGTLRGGNGNIQIDGDIPPI